MMMKDRVVYMNDALSGLYGHKIRMIAQDIYRSRRLVYDSNKRRMDDDQLYVYLESKVDAYQRVKYKNEYGVYENVSFSDSHSKDTDLHIHDTHHLPHLSMSSCIRSLISVNNKRL